MLRLFTTAFALSVAAGQAQAALIITYGSTTNLHCSGGVCVATNSDATFGIKDIQKRLANGNLTVVADSIAGDIVVDAPFSWTASHNLELFAAHSIIVNKTVDVAGPGGVTLTSNDSRSDGLLSFGPKGSVHFWATANALTINYAPYLLVNSLPALISAIGAHPSSNFALANDYDASAHGTYTSVPVTTIKTAFDGLGHTIKRLAVRANTGTSNPASLVNLVTVNGSVSHLKLAGARFWGRYGGELGGIAIQNQGLIASDTVQATMTGTATNIGGIAAENSGTVRDCHVDVQMSATGGGLGGIVGNNSAGALVDRSSAKGTLTGGGGGIVGSNAGMIRQSWSQAVIVTGNSNGFTHPAGGGLVAVNADQSATVTIADSYAVGSVTGGTGADVGGLVGAVRFKGTIANTYSSGAVGGGSGSTVGGTIGSLTGTETLTGNYWDLDTSGISDPSRGAGDVSNTPGITGLTDAALKSALPSGFDPSVWGQDAGINGGLPYLLNNPPN